MKIFNWMSKKFGSNKVDDCYVSHKKDAKTETATNDTDTAVLLGDVAFLDVWKDGILTIGTLGFDSLKLQNQQIEYSVEEEEESYVDVVEECPLAEGLAEGDGPLVVKAEIGKIESVTTLTNPKQNVSAVDAPETPLLQFVESIQVNIETQTHSTKKRTTLADLFSAECDVVGHSGIVEAATSDFDKKPRSPTKHGILFVKKIVPRKAQDTRPIKKLSKMMTKMLKKKIHPEVEGKTHRKDSNASEQRCTSRVDNGGATESVSLLRGFLLQP